MPERTGLPRPRDDLRDLRPYRTQQQPAELRLQSNEWAELTPAARYADALAGVELNRYPDTAARELGAILAAQWDVGADQLLLGNGSNEVLLDAFLLYGGPSRRLLVFTPTYTMYARLARIVGMTVVADPVGLPYAIDPPRVRDAIARHHPHITCICSPNNPTGSLVAPEAILAAAEAARESLVLVDEAYADFAGVTMIPHIARHRNLVVARTFSKARAAAGLRLGALVGDAEVIERLDGVRLPYNLSAVTQALAARIAQDRPALERRVALVADERSGLIEALGERAELEVFPSVANFVLFRHRSRSAADLHAALLEVGVLVRDVSGWPGADECLRVTVGTREENARFLAAVRTALGEAARVRR